GIFARDRSPRPTRNRIQMARARMILARWLAASVGRHTAVRRTGGTKRQAASFLRNGLRAGRARVDDAGVRSAPQARLAILTRAAVGSGVAIGAGRDALVEQANRPRRTAAARAGLRGRVAADAPHTDAAVALRRVATAAWRVEPGVDGPAVG